MGARQTPTIAQQEETSMWTQATMTMTVLESPVPVGITELVRLLDQLRALVERLDDRTYAEPPAGRPSGSIGAHIRHSLDHVTAFLEGVTSGVLSYDRRVRNTRLETDRRVALAKLADASAALIELPPSALDRPLRLDVQLDASGIGCCSVITTGGRELAFVISHTIHHNATMAVLLSDARLRLPHRFGYAAATPDPAAA
jgi:uncharacterized damage-inducible protein DinB